LVFVIDRRGRLIESEDEAIKESEDEENPEPRFLYTFVEVSERR